MKSKSHVAFVSFESAYAPFGGLASVLTKIVSHVGYHLGSVIHVFTPYHWQLPKTAQLTTAIVGTVTVPDGVTYVTIRIHRYEETMTIEGKQVVIHWHFLQADDKQFFNGVKHPYDLGKTENVINRNLLRHSLLFGAATARAIELLFPTEHVTVVMQDWSALTTALALPPSTRFSLRACLHNGYDSAVTENALRLFGFPSGVSFGETVLTRALRLVRGPILTVSQQFALDLAEDIFQSQVFTPHLQSLFSVKRLYGSDHGPFVPLKFDPKLVGEILRGNPKRLAAWKKVAKQEAVKLVSQLTSSEDKPVWGDVAKFVSDSETPLFLMGGRMDSRQKGFDVCAKAVSSVIESGEARGKWLLLPMEGIEGRDGLLFLKKLAERYPDRVLVLPFIWKEGFASVSAAAAFGLVCSFYEPGGLSSEFIANATPIICSATGGSVMQVVPWRAAATMHQGVQAKCDRWHARCAPPTGIVYDARQHTLAGWQDINAGGYSVGGEPDIVQHREGIPLFNDLAGELALAMTEAIRLYHDAAELYYEMATNGVIHFQRNFSWLKAGAEYARQLAS